MSTSTLPVLVGLAFPVTRTSVWDTDIQSAASGKETRLAFQTYPRYMWEASYSALRSAVAYSEFQQLLGFYNARQGNFDTFLYQDPDDKAVTGQGIGTGDGSTLTFQLVRGLGGFAEPVLAPNVVSAVYVDGTPISSSFWSVSPWGGATPGLVSFTSGHAPTSGKAVTADFTYYWPCRFDQDQTSFLLFNSQNYRVQKLAWKSVKN